MTPDEKRIEVRRLLAFIYFEYPRPIDDLLVRYWLGFLQGYSKSEVWEAAKFMLTQELFGAPKIRDLYRAMKRLRERGAQVVRDNNVTEFIVDDDVREFELARGRMTEAEQRILSDLRDALGGEVLPGTQFASIASEVKH